MMLPEIELIGQKVKLIPLQESHTEELFKVGNFPEVWTYMTIHVQSVNDMKKFVQDALKQKELGLVLPFTVLDKVSGQVLGSTRYLNITEKDKGLEIGFTWYTPSVWRSHVNTECKYLLLKHSFEELRFNRVQIKTDTRNEKSNKAILRIGAKFEGTLRRDRIMPDGYLRDANLYSIIAEEWPDVKIRFEQQLLR